jgi:hypothetical protein
MEESNEEYVGTRTLLNVSNIASIYLKKYTIEYVRMTDTTSFFCLKSEEFDDSKLIMNLAFENIDPQQTLQVISIKLKEELNV